jgi:hypothetical protein
MPDRAGMSPRKTTEVDSMKRAILILATALLGTTTACSSHSCANENDLNVFWDSFTAADGTTFACTDPRSGVAGLQVFVGGVPQLLDRNGQPAPVPCVPFPAQSSAQGVTLADFAPGTYDVEVQAYDTAGNLLFDDQQSIAITRTCGGTELSAALVATTGSLTVATTFQGQQTCAAAGVQNFFIELVDSNGTALTGPNGQSFACIDSAGSLPSFTLTGLAFGQTYTFRTLAGTAANSSGVQAFRYVQCGVPVTFTGVTPSIRLDLPLAQAGFAACP